MSSATRLSENSTALSHPDDGQANVIAGPPLTSMRGYELILTDATKQVWQHPKPTIRDPFEKTIIEFSDALESSFVVIAEGFTSFNKSVFDVGTSNPVVEAQLERLFSVAHEEQFEVGVESRFSGNLQQLSAYDPVAVLQSLKARLIDSAVSSEVLAEILRWTSRQEADAIHDLVADLLSAGLHHSSSLVRDAAALGLAYLNKGESIIQIKLAIEREKVPELRKDLEDLILSLEN